MNYIKLYSKFFFVPLIIGLLSVMCVATACSDDDEEELRADFGYVQFKLLKSASFDKEKTTRASDDALSDKLEMLNDAKKVKVVMHYNGATISQTLMLNAYNAENAEFGLRSDKLQLMAGNYTIVGFYLYDKLDKVMYAGPAGTNSAFTVVSGGLHQQSLLVDAVSRGMVTFKLVKKFTKTRANETGTYPFSNIKMVKFTLKNLFTQELTETTQKVAVKYKTGFNEDGSEMEYAECDTVMWLKAGSYQVSSYSTYSSKNDRDFLETAPVHSSETFVVKDNERTENAEIPIALSKTAEYIKDYMALKAIWEKMDGPNWSYYGEAAPIGCNWNFNKDIDMWGDQPGVQLFADGRVATLSFEGFGVKGDVPDELGQLTELRILSLGTHSEMIGGRLFGNGTQLMTDAQKRAVRMDYDAKFLARDPREGLSDFLQESINRDKDMKPIKNARVSTKDVQIGNLTNDITGISKAMMRLTNLEQFFIANAPIGKNGAPFFKEIAPDSPFYEEQEEGTLSWSNFNSLLDIEIYNCPSLTELPMEMLTELPELQSLNIACNKGISGATLRQNWIDFIHGNSGAKIQIMYMGYNNLVEFPEYDDLKQMVKLGMLDCTHNQLEKVHPFGKGVNLVKFYLDFNKIKSIEPADDGYFFGYAGDVESFTCSNNELTQVPDIFSTKSNYVMGSVDFSYNKIESFANGKEFRGINASTVNLAYNRLATFPGILFEKNSPMSALVLSGNGMKSIPKGSLIGEMAYLLRTLDLTFNKLSELPDDFYADNLPYLYGLDLSYNSFSKFPTKPLNVATLTAFGIRHQRDEKGNRTLREWPTGLYTCPSLTQFTIGSNDLRKIEDTISPYIRVFDIKDNPNITIDLSTVCSYIKAGMYLLIYDKTQDIRGCDALDLEK